MTIKLEISKAPQCESDVLASQQLVNLVRGWAKSLQKPENCLEVWVGGLIYLAGQQIGYYDESSGEAVYAHPDSLKSNFLSEACHLPVAEQGL